MSDVFIIRLLLLMVAAFFIALLYFVVRSDIQNQPATKPTPIDIVPETDIPPQDIAPPNVPTSKKKKRK